ncbi:EthD domain-containing protein [Calycina marina]|uniref:EthD domain-containing protein n=1 Tax=Calycina marina TaxID=1763456 RepID=A0A9P8CB93_9HELO|nr:EthD domain-containing protein [Calycina marina]
MATKERVLKFTVMQHRNPNISEDEFHTYWTKKHAVLASIWLERNGILGYTQYHTPKATRDLAVGFADQIGWKLSTYDGHVEFIVRSVDDLSKAVQDPEYPEKIAPDEQYLLDPSTSMVTVGWEEVYILDGKLVSQGGAGTD